MSDEEPDGIAEIAKHLLENALPREFVANYVLICETVDQYGNDLQVISNTDASPWLILGMLKYATEAMCESVRETNEFDGEDFEGDGS